MNAPFCPLPITDTRRAYVPADRTDISKTFEEHRAILVCGIGDIRDDYEHCDQTGYLEQLGAWK